MAVRSQHQQLCDVLGSLIRKHLVHQHARPVLDLLRSEGNATPTKHEIDVWLVTSIDVENSSRWLLRVGLRNGAGVDAAKPVQ